MIDNPCHIAGPHLLCYAMPYGVLQTLKRKFRHFEEIYTSGCTDELQNMKWNENFTEMSFPFQWSIKKSFDQTVELSVNQIKIYSTAIHTVGFCLVLVMLTIHIRFAWCSVITHIHQGYFKQKRNASVIHADFNPGHHSGKQYVPWMRGSSPITPNT